jgi:hypothetical protein
LLELGLATYRLTRLLVIENGPFDIFLKLRGAMGAYDYGNDGRPYSFAGELISCPYCTGVWVAILLTLSPRWLRLIVFSLAVAGIQAALQSWIEEE